jgi:uncharacterized protein (TIRG00374 family)
MNTIAPSLNMSGNMMFIDDARRRGIRVGHATTAALLMQMSIETGFMVIMVVGFVIMFAHGSLTPVMFGFGLFVVFLVVVMGAVMVLAHKSPATLTRVLRPFERAVGFLSRTFRRKEMAPWVDTVAAALSDAAGEVTRNPRQAVYVFLLSVLASTFELACFCLVGFAFGITDISALLGGYVIAILFTMVAITPMGLGVVEAAIVVLLRSYAIDLPAATAVTLVFRGIVFWLPFALGALLIRRSKSFRKPDKE